MPTQTVNDRALVALDPSDIRVFEFDWDDELADGVAIVTSVITITKERGATSPMLTSDNEDIAPGGRSTSLRLSTPALGAIYRVDNRVTTDENPPQTIERHCKIIGRTL